MRIVQTSQNYSISHFQSLYNLTMSKKDIYYSDKYTDDKYEYYRHSKKKRPTETSQTDKEEEEGATADAK